MCRSNAIGSMCERTRARSRLDRTHTQICSVHRYTIVQCPSPKTLQCPLFLTTKIWSVRFFHYKTLQCSLFGTTKIHSLLFFIKFAVSAFFITKICSVRFLALQKFIVSSFLLELFVISTFPSKNCAVSTFYDYKRLQSLLFQKINVCTSILQCP